MKTRKFIILLSSLLVLSSCTKPVNPTPTPEEKGPVIINGFDNTDDLYRSKQLLDQISYGVDCEITINKENVHSGDGSLKLVYNNSIYGQIYQRNALSPIKDEDMSDISKFGGWFYNNNDFDTSLSLNVVGKETVVLSSYEVEFPSKTWINPEYLLNKVVMDTVQDDVRGFSFKIGKCPSYPATFYADELYVDFNAKTTEEDDLYLEEIEALMQEINNLPEIISPSDSANIAKCKEIAERYSQIPTIYQPAITNYQTFMSAMQSYVDAVASDTATDSDVIAYHFDTCFGLSQTSFLYTQTQFPLNVSTEKKFGDEEASLKLSLNGRILWSEFIATSAVNMQNYEYIEFSIYNDTPAKIAFCLSWDTTHIANKGQWTTFKISTNYASFMPTYMIEWEFTGNDFDYYGDGLPHAIDGDLYISQVKLHRASASKFIEMVNALPSVISESDEEQIKEIRRFYEGLHKDEKAKITEQDYNKLVKAEYNLQALFFGKLGSMIDALPEVNDIKPYSGTFINKAYSIYLIMTQEEKDALLTLSQCQKMENVYQAYTDVYGLVLSAEALAGENVGISWDIRANGTYKVDDTYGDIVDYKISKKGTGTLNGAFEFMFDNLDVSMYKSVTFYVKPAHDDKIFISRSAWRGGDSNKGFIIEKPISANVWNEVTVSASDFAECSYIEFYFSTDVSINDSYSFTSFYGVKK